MRNLVMRASAVVVCAFVLFAPARAQRRTTRAAVPKPTAAATTTTTTPTKSTSKSLVIYTEPNASVWLDDLRRGTTKEDGTLAVANVSAGRHTLRIRAVGFKEATLPLLPTQRGDIKVTLTPSTDAAELSFQKAEALHESAADNTAREAALALYDEALRANPRPSLRAAIHLGRARTYFDLADHDAALAAITDARRSRPVFPEATAVEGRILRSMGDNDAAVLAYRRAIREGRGTQPEAYTGLGIIYSDKSDHAQAALAFTQALKQLADTEPVVYQLLGSVYEQQENYKQAVTAYEKYLALAPDGKLAPAIRSIIEQLKKQAAGENTLPY